MGKKAANLPTGQSQYQVVGRYVPNDKYPEDNAQCKVYRMNLFAKNKVVARSRFWYFMKRLCRVKKANGQIISVSQVITAHNRERAPSSSSSSRRGSSSRRRSRRRNAGHAAATTHAVEAAAAAMMEVAAPAMEAAAPQLNSGSDRCEMENRRAGRSSTAVGVPCASGCLRARQGSAEAKAATRALARIPSGLLWSIR